MEQFVETEWCGAKLRISTGKVAKQASGAVWLQNGDTIILATATMSKEPKTGLDFFPHLRLRGAQVRRRQDPGRIYQARRTARREVDPRVSPDRPPLRPLFPSGMRNETQIIATPLSYQPEFPPTSLPSRPPPPPSPCPTSPSPGRSAVCGSVWTRKGSSSSTRPTISSWTVRWTWSSPRRRKPSRWSRPARPRSRGADAGRDGLRPRRLQETLRPPARAREEGRRHQGRGATAQAQRQTSASSAGDSASLGQGCRTRTRPAARPD